MHTPEPTARLDAIRAAFAEHEISALVISSSENCRYLSGFTGSNGMLLITPTHAGILTDFRYREQVARQAPDWTLHEMSAEKPLLRLLAELLVQQQVPVVGFEAQHTTVAQHTRLCELLAEVAADAGATEPLLAPVSGLAEKLREQKHSTELALLRQAIAITDAALAAVLPTLQPSDTERQVAWRLEVAMRERGAEQVSFSIIVAAGRNAALPHYGTGDASLGTGQPIIIDMGARVAGYHADLTRTVVLGEPDARFQQVYAAVLAAQQAAITQIRAGIKGSDADALARAVLADAGLDEYFGHGLGHGVGLQIHESPRLGRSSEQELQAGMVFSVEPGVYLPDWGGVRIEDLVLLTDDGCTVLSQSPK